MKKQKEYEILFVLLLRACGKTVRRKGEFCNYALSWQPKTSIFLITS